MSNITQKTVVTVEQVGRVDKVVQMLTSRSRSQIRGLVDHNCVTINGAPCESDFEPVVAGDEVAVTYNPHQNYPEKPRARSDAPFRLLHEDEDLLVVEKPAHMLTVPTPKRETDTLVHHLQNYVSLGRKKLGRVEIVHRLDRGVSGVLVFAKSARIAEALRAQFAAHKPEREYLALVAGTMERDSGTFDKNLVTDDETIHRSVAEKPGQGESAVTHYEVVKRLPGATLVRVRLETGRRNQIRVHFADAGHPVLGDPRYGGEKAQHRRWTARRMALHAATLVFTHPTTGKKMRFEAPVPKEIHAFTR
jgi:23S rRNA pseudouridine1911/1915/1917 synthase